MQKTLHLFFSAKCLFSSLTSFGVKRHRIESSYLNVFCVLGLTYSYCPRAFSVVQLCSADLIVDLLWDF